MTHMSTAYAQQVQVMPLYPSNITGMLEQREGSVTNNGGNHLAGVFKSNQNT